MTKAGEVHQVLIAGAGPAGLAVAARLREVGLDHIIIEKGTHVGERWHHHYDRVHLHTVKKRSHLPLMPFPAEYPTYVPRDMLIKYFESYKSRFRIEPRFGTAIEKVRRQDGLWHVTTNNGDLTAERVVLAIGANRVEHVPVWKGQDSFGGTFVHSRFYRNAKPFVGDNVLVVGMGNTGAEIALDLAENGVGTWLSVRGPVNIVPRDLNGRPVQETGRVLAKIPFGIGDWLSSLVQGIYFGDLTKYGLERSRITPSVQLRETGKTPVIDVGTVRAIKQGRIRVVPALTGFSPGRAHFADGTEQEIDHVILATGYRPDLEPLVERIDEFLDAHGYPKQPVGTGFHDGLYFVGYNNYELGGILGTIYRESGEIVNDILGRKEEA